MTQIVSIKNMSQKVKNTKTQEKQLECHSLKGSFTQKFSLQSATVHRTQRNITVLCVHVKGN